MAIPTKRKHHPKNRQTKTFLEFDEKARAEYLKGFQKRKNERKKLAREKKDKRILEERKELLKQVREGHKSSQQSIIVPEIEHLVEPEIFDLPEHTVTISNIGDVDFVGKTGLRLGKNVDHSSDTPDDRSGTEEVASSSHKPIKSKSLKQKLASCSNQLSSQKAKTKKMKKKQMLRQKFQQKKKGKGKKKSGKKK